MSTIREIVIWSFFSGVAAKGIIVELWKGPEACSVSTIGLYSVVLLGNALFLRLAIRDLYSRLPQ